MADRATHSCRKDAFYGVYDKSVIEIWIKIDPHYRRQKIRSITQFLEI